MPGANPTPFRHPRRDHPFFRRPRPAAGGPALVAPPRLAITHRGRRRFLPLVLASVLLHAVIIAAFWWRRPQPTEELSSPPGVTMLFNQGATEPAAQPGPATAPAAPMAAPVEPSPEPDATSAQAPTQPEPPPAPPAPPEPAPTPAPPLPEAPPVPETRPAPASPPVVAKPPDTGDLPAVHFQAPQSLQAFLVPVPIPQPLPMPPPPAPRPAPPKRPSPPAQSQASSFPRPMFNSLGGSLSGVPEGQREVTRSGGSALQPFAQTSGTPLGAGWNELFRKWIESHKYYPRQAAELGQQGVVAVEITIQNDGHVSDLHLVERSGSPWLDMALQSMFRDAHVPAFPPGTTEPSVTYRVQMTYELR